MQPIGEEMRRACEIVHYGINKDIAVRKVIVEHVDPDIDLSTNDCYHE